MTRTLKQTIMCALGVVLTSMTLAAASQVYAQQYDQKCGDTLTFFVDRESRDLEVYEVLSLPGRLVTIQFPEEITAARSPAPAHLNVLLRGNILLVEAKADTAANATTHVVVETAKKRVQFIVRNAHPWESIKQSVILRERPHIDEQHTRFQADNRPLVAVLEDRQWEHRALHPTDVTTRGGSLSVGIRRARWRGLDLQIDAEIINRTLRPYILGQVQVFLGGQQQNRAGQVQVSLPGWTEDGVVAFIPPGERVPMVVSVPNAARQHAITPLILRLTSADGQDFAEAEVNDWFLVPMTDEDIKEEKRKKEAKGKVSVHVQAFGGVIWISNPVDVERLDPAVMRGLGVRMTYGISPILAIEADVIGARSGDASFDKVRLPDMDMEGQDMHGELTRRASLGRAQFGGVLRLGHTTIPTLRLALGAQGIVGHGSAFIPDNDEQTGTPDIPEASFELGMMVILGAGLDIRIGDHVLLGASTSFAEPINGLSRSFEAGVHVGYAWKP